MKRSIIITTTTKKIKIKPSKLFTRGNVALLGGTSAIIGSWAFSCLISAANIDGPLGLAKGFLTAVTGL